ncbi:PepSY domain-containing protein [Tardiphaga alba]|uniref:PepSY domain-containing protein n=1 Tax=Tardiphaga alba TaxID=340268 RepID=UPI002013B24C|nr:PepSY domain-containing protein [Tardiphaga alba]
MPIEKAIEKAETLGYAVKKAKRSKGCWEVEGFDSHGAEVEIRIDPVSGEIVKPADWRAGKRKAD